MATANFRKLEEPCIYAFETEHEFDWEDTIENVRYELFDAFQDDPDLYIVEPDNQWETRSHKVIAVIHLNVHDIDAEVRCTVASGYYSGGNFGYRTGMDCDDWRKDVQEELDVITDKVGEIYEMFTQKLTILGAASNGEAFYSPIK